MTNYYEHLISKYRFRFMDERLTPLGLSGPLGFYLMKIDQHSSIKMNELMSMTPYHKSHGTRVIQKLLTMKLIDKIPDPEDLRAFIITITPLGSTKAMHVKQAQLDWEKLVHEALTDEENALYLALTIKTYLYLKSYFNEDVSDEKTI